MATVVDFTGKVVVVVGGTSGINRGIARCFASNGAKVAVAGRKQEKVDETVNELSALGAQAMGFSADVHEPDGLEAGMQSVHERFGEFDVVVSGAAGNFPALSNDLSWNGFKTVIDIDLRGTFHVMKAIFPRLRKPGASVINISAPQSFVPMKAQLHVCAAKAGVDMITRTLALEWGPSGVRVNSIVPGPIEGTEGMARLMPDDNARTRAIAGVPLGRLGSPADVGNACLFLGSELGSYVSGVVLAVDGGWAQTNCGGLSDDLGTLAARSARQRGVS